MKRVLFLVVLSLPLLVSGVRGQERVYLSENFDKRPPYWSWSEEYHDANIDRYYKNSELVVDARSSWNGWILAYRPIDPKQSWYVNLAMRIDRSDFRQGSGICVQAGSRFLFFKIGGGERSYWIGTFDNSTKAWTTENTLGANGEADKISPHIRANGKENMLKIEAANQRLRFFINDSLVEDLAMSGALAPFSTSMGSVGLMYSGEVKCSYLTFNASYVLPAMKTVKDAFVGVKKTIVKELLAPGSRSPKMSPNGQQIYYTASDTITWDDVLVADATSDSTWSKGVNVGPPINNKAANSVVSVSQDGNELMLWGQYNADGSYRAEGFSTSRRTATGWSTPTDIVTNHARSTSPTREECVSADRSVAILARQIEGNTIGNKDLYASFRQADGSYGPLVNLGPNVNTVGSEHGPFLAADNRTLYWFSDHETYGDADIFVAKRLDDTWTNWTPRVNLGPSINSAQWDAYFCIHPSGKYAYMNSSDGYDWGICRLDLPNDSATRSLLPDPVVIVKGRVLHAKTKQPLGVEIRYDDLGTGKNIGTAVSEPKEGRYSVVLTGGRSYGFYANRDGFFPVSDNIELLDLKQYQVVERDLYLEPIEVGATIRLNNLFFDTDKAILRAESTAELDRLIALLKARTTIVISIDGHTDDRGTDAHNNKLSTDRANAVMAYLVKAGIPSDRLKAKGYGKSKPVQKGTSDAARQQNRRVEFSIASI